MFNEIDKTMLPQVGGKGANLGELSKIKEINVPEGFCITTKSYKKTIDKIPELPNLIEQLSHIKVDDRERISKISGQIRSIIEKAKIDDDIANDITSSLTKLGVNDAYAVRSSATAEDLPTASFAGQQDTFLNTIGREAIFKNIKKCWASLFTDRAVTYRIQNGFDHNKVLLSVVIQKMVFPEASGIMFTADPITSDRKVVSIDASFGLGEALVSGLVNADSYKVNNGKIESKKVSAKKLGIYPLKGGGTEENKIELNLQNKEALTDDQILQLEKIGRKIGAYFGKPQDIEWCLYENKFYIVQSRPITTLYPLPDVKDGKNHVYMSFGHQQMMTDAMKPLGISFFQFAEALLVPIGGRLYMDVTHDLASSSGRAMVGLAMGKVDPLMDKAIKKLMKRKDYIKTLPKGKKFLSMGSGYFSWALIAQTIKTYRKNDPSIVKHVIAKNEENVKDVQQKISKLSGDELLAFIKNEYANLNKTLYDAESMGTVWAGAILGSTMLNRKIKKWLGQKDIVDSLTQSVDNNITGEMGLDLLDVSDVVRKYPDVMKYLEHAKDETFFTELVKLKGGDEVSNSIKAYLEKYGMRCSGEIDITRPRWNEEPTAIVPLILSNIKNFEPGAHEVIFKKGLSEFEAKKKDILDRLAKLPGGKNKVKKAEKAISIVRNYIGYREYPKYAMVSIYWVLKQAMMKEAVKLEENGVIKDKNDIFYLSFEELQEAARTQKLDYDIITKRKEEFKSYEKLTPPRIILSDGEIISGEYDNEKMPKGALAGIPASRGTIEGRARVVLRLEDATMEEGDILVTTFTDPSWTPVFVSIKGLVAEVGGAATHGSVVAREYGLPAVVGVDNATKLIKDGQRIRVNGTDGYVEILS